MPISKAQQAATNRYKMKVYDRLNILVTKGRKSELQTHAQTKGESLNGFVNRAIDETVERDKKTALKKDGWQIGIPGVK